MRFSETRNDVSVLTELGRRLSAKRLDLSLTQAALARRAGVGKRTVERLEAGGSVQATSLFRVFRVLALLPALDAALPETGPRPMDLLALKGKSRKRASSPRAKAESVAERAWKWGDET